MAFKLFSALANKKINVDIILQSVGRDGTKDISFTVAEDHAEDAVACLNEMLPVVGGQKVMCDVGVSKVSIVGSGMETHPGVAATMFEALFDADVNIQMISTSEIKISVLISREDGAKAVTAIHDAFIN